MVIVVLCAENYCMIYWDGEDSVSVRPVKKVKISVKSGNSVVIICSTQGSVYKFPVGADEYHVLNEFLLDKYKRSFHFT